MGIVLGMKNHRTEPEVVTATYVHRNLRTVLFSVKCGETYTVSNYGKHEAVIMPMDLYLKAMAALEAQGNA